MTKQTTFGTTVGLPPVVDCADHPSDMVRCSDGMTRAIGDVVRDCKNEAHADSETAHDANVDIVTGILMAHDKWVLEYTTENTDYTSGYDHCVDETSHDWPVIIKRWIEDKDHWLDRLPSAEMDKFIGLLCENLSSWDCEPEYYGNEYACYSGNGLCLWAFEIGEYENQIEMSSHVELQALHDAGKLDDVLNDVNCDVHISRDRKRVKNEATGHYEYTGRESYDHHNSDHPCLMAYHIPGGQWQFVVPAETMNEKLTETTLAYLRSK